MVYLIPRGTPIEIARYGCSGRPHMAKRDLAFSEPLTATAEELVFHDGYWRVVVARAMVLAAPGREPEAAVESSCQTAV